MQAVVAGKQADVLIWTLKRGEVCAGARTPKGKWAMRGG